MMNIQENRQLRNNIIVNDTPSHDGVSEAGINPNIEAILSGMNRGPSNDDNKSDVKSIKRKRGRRKKIRIDTL